MSGVVAVAGSRALSGAGLALVGPVCRSVLASGRSLSVGCAVGVDAAVLGSVGAAFPGRVRCFAAFGPGPGFAGSWRGSDVAAVRRFAAHGGGVSWLAGGPLSLPLRARLASRTSAVVSAASVACVVFFSSPASRGSALAARLAAARGLPVVGFPCGFSGEFLPSLGSGSWVPFSGFGPWVSAWVWESSQLGFF